MQKIAGFILLVMFAWPFPSVQAALAPGSGPNEMIESSLPLLDRLSVDNVNRFIEQANRQMEQNLPLLTAEKLKEIAAGGFGAQWQKGWQFVQQRLFYELKANAFLLGNLIILAVLCALLQNLSSSFGEAAVATLGHAVCFVFLMVMVLNAFNNAVSLARTTVDAMTGFLEALLPLLIALLAGVGAITTSGMFTPLMLLLVSTASVVINNVVLPLLLFATFLDCLNRLSDKYSLGNLAKLLKQASMICLGATLVVFIGVITVQGVAGSVADGVALRTAKYATSTFVPVIGKMFADTVEMIMGASLLLKNAVGIFGLVIVSGLCAFPLLKLLVLALVAKLAGALVQPMGEERMAKCLDAVGDNILLLFSTVLTAALMFFVAVTIVVAAGNMAVMLR